ncbi:MAG: hypothetical protein CK426_02600 [Legionella sp.]|nr:MAG: hypothetical protein CK423_03400 [Legionella sp.]PJD99686.1 MAG: hypothetical protein CK426_02600 [Legionella sp.]
MTFQVVNYEQLKANIQESIKQLLKHHFPDMSDTSELKSRVALLEPERRTQTEVLLTVIELCDAMKDEDSLKKQTILNAAAFDTYSQIKKSYQGFISLVATEENSTFFLSLETSLALTKTNVPNTQEQLGLYRALEEFFKSHVYVGGRPENGCRTPDTSPFWMINNSNENFDPIDHVKRLGKRVYKLQNKLHDEAGKLHEKAVRPSTSSYAKLSWFSWTAKSSEPISLTPSLSTATASAASAVNNTPSASEDSVTPGLNTNA